MNQLHQGAVSHNPNENAKLPIEERVANLEKDVVMSIEVMQRIAAQNDKYADYLDTRIKREQESHEFWMDVKKRVIGSGIYGFILIVTGALAFSIKEWVKT